MSRGKGGDADEKAKGKGRSKGAKGEGKAKGKGKKGGGDAAAPKARRQLVRSPHVALLGLLGLALIAVMMLRGELDLLQAGQRAGVLLGVVLVLERLVLPVCRALVGPPGAPGEQPAGR